MIFTARTQGWRLGNRLHQSACSPISSRFWSSYERLSKNSVSLQASEEIGDRAGVFVNPFRTDVRGLGENRFWNTCSVRKLGLQSEENSGRDRYHICLDDVVLKTNSGCMLVVPTHALAAGVALEWETQKEQLRPSTMPLTRLVSVAFELSQAQRLVMKGDLMSLFSADAVCCIARTPASLQDKQMRLWSPLIRYVNETYGWKLNMVDPFVERLRQTDSCRDTMTQTVDSMDKWSFVAFHVAASLCKSVVIPIALRDGHINARDALLASHCDEDWQTDRFGTVEGHHDVEFASLSAELGAADVIFRMAKQFPSAFH